MMSKQAARRPGRRFSDSSQSQSYQRAATAAAGDGGTRAALARLARAHVLGNVEVLAYPEGQALRPHTSEPLLVRDVVHPPVPH